MTVFLEQLSWKCLAGVTLKLIFALVALLGRKADEGNENKTWRGLGKDGGFFFESGPFLGGRTPAGVLPCNHGGYSLCRLTP